MYEPTVAGQRVQIRNIPFATDTLTLTAKASYRFANRDRIELAYANKSVDYSNREDRRCHRSSVLGAVCDAHAIVRNDAHCL